MHLSSLDEAVPRQPEASTSRRSIVTLGPSLLPSKSRPSSALGVVRGCSSSSILSSDPETLFEAPSGVRPAAATPADPEGFPALFSAATTVSSKSGASCEWADTTARSRSSSELRLISKVSAFLMDTAEDAKSTLRRRIMEDVRMLMNLERMENEPIGKSMEPGELEQLWSGLPLGGQEAQQQPPAVDISPVAKGIEQDDVADVVEDFTTRYQRFATMPAGLHERSTTAASSYPLYPYPELPHDGHPSLHSSLYHHSPAPAAVISPLHPAAFPNTMYYPGTLAPHPAPMWYPGTLHPSAYQHPYPGYPYYPVAGDERAPPISSSHAPVAASCNASLEAMQHGTQRPQQRLPGRSTGRRRSISVTRLELRHRQAVADREKKVTALFSKTRM
eukprot:GHVU01013144.1.p1 GENE.GHVU01013144.1~~GHVU01013144.1.p1  ORF type:complete len:390 (-),score=29.93 GHVU01013144.1:419-1588(-)